MAVNPKEENAMQNAGDRLRRSLDAFSVFDGEKRRTAGSKIWETWIA